MLFRLVDNTPPVYTEESRDFQLFLRLYDAAINSTINDIDLMQYITDSKRCKTELLALEKSRLGFFTNYQMSSEMIRAILVGFPELLRNKGSLNGVVYATNLFLKALNIKSDIIIYYTAEGEVAFERTINDHTVVIGINEAIDNYYVLEELLKYILPAGFGFSFFFYKDYNKYDWIRDLNSSELLYVGNDYADSLRYNIYDSSTTYSVDDIVIYNGKAYTCLISCTGTAPDTSSTYWTINEAVTRIVSSVSTLGIYSGSYSDAVDSIEQNYLADTDTDYDISVKLRYDRAWRQTNSIRITSTIPSDDISNATYVYYELYDLSDTLLTTVTVNASDYSTDYLLSCSTTIASNTSYIIVYAVDSDSTVVGDSITITVKD